MKQLFKNRCNRTIGGVCYGIGEYFNIDPTIVKILFVLGCFLWCSTLWIYLILWVLLPEKY
jgi:phage shock protein PspC (stress-responsive transcriptional regulator)